MIKIKPGFLLQKMLNEDVVVSIGSATKAFRGMIKLNESGLILWKELEKGTDKESLIAVLMEKYPELDKETAASDIEEFLESIKVTLTDA